MVIRSDDADRGLPRVRRTAVAFCCAVVLLAGCTRGDDKPEPRAAVPDACTILTTADLTTAFGADPGAGRPGGAPDRQVCTYSTGTVVGVAQADQYDRFVATSKQNADAKCTDVRGIGTAANFCVIYGSVGQLAWKQGPLMYDVSGPAIDVNAYRPLAAKVTS